jgi:cytochrome c-type biogenesis protein CcmH
MTLWFVLALMTGAAVLAALWPLVRGARQPSGASDVAVYRDQLAEVRRDLAAGQIGETEAQAAEREISRRLLAAADASAANTLAAPSLIPRRHRQVVALAVLLLLPVGVAALYFGLGSPGMPDQPLAPRLEAAHGGAPIANLIAQVEAHLQQQPDDGRGWEVIAPVYMRLGRFDEAVTARRNALRLNGETGERAAALGEALVFSANGVVTAEAKAVFDRAIALDASQVQARYFIGLAAEQDGDRQRAVSIWQDLLASAPPDAPWTAFVQHAIDGLRTGGDHPPAGPSDEQIAASSKLGEDQREGMVRGMVERLAERLRHDGSDPDGWARLVRSYMVLGEADKAHAAAADARRALANEEAKLRRFEEQVAAMGGTGASANRPSGGPSQEQIASSAQLSADQRDTMVHGMVDRLAQRLARDGSDPDGWLRLVRSYMVLGEAEKARAAAADARRALANDEAKLQRFETQMKALGVAGSPVGMAK